MAYMEQEQEQEKKITFVRVVQTSFACPSQWDAWDAEGNYFYCKYRYGHGQVRHYKTEDWVEAHDDQLIDVVADFTHGHPLDGSMTLEEFAQHAGIILAPSVMVTGYGDYVYDELVFGGTIGLEDSDEPK